MVPPETDVGADDADQRAADDVEAVMVVVGVAGAADVDGHRDGDEGDDPEVGRRRSRLVADRDDGGVQTAVRVVVVVGVRVGGGGGGEGGFAELVALGEGVLA